MLQANSKGNREGPVAVGGIGGSGTRLVARILLELGFYLGSDLNEALDNLWFTRLFKRAEALDCSDAEFGSLFSTFREAMSGVGEAARWGWKEPNTHVVLPRLNALLPELRYIHVARNGLDMAYSSNQNQLEMLFRNGGQGIENQIGKNLGELFCVYGGCGVRLVRPAAFR